MFSHEWAADYGGLASYGPTWYELGRRAARLIDSMLKGASTSQSTLRRDVSERLTINLHSATRLGIDISPDILAQADRLVR